MTLEAFKASGGTEADGPSLAGPEECPAGAQKQLGDLIDQHYAAVEQSVLEPREERERRAELVEGAGEITRAAQGVRRSTVQRRRPPLLRVG